MSEQGKLWDLEALADARACHSPLAAETLTGGTALGWRSLASYERLLTFLALARAAAPTPLGLSLVLHADCPDR